ARLPGAHRRLLAATGLGLPLRLAGLRRRRRHAARAQSAGGLHRRCQPGGAGAGDRAVPHRRLRLRLPVAGELTVADMNEIQLIDANPYAELLVPVLLEIPVKDPFTGEDDAFTQEA